MQNPPFFYKVSFHLLTQEKNKELKHESWQKEFHNPDPFIARQEALEEFGEYLKFLKTNNKIEKDEYGNYRIISPADIPEMPNLDKNRNIDNYLEIYFDYLEFREDLNLILIITDDDLLDEIEYGDSTLAIHSVSSHSVHKQYFMDNLKTEMRLYQRHGLDTMEYAQVVKHYGEDYSDSGEDEEAVDYTILPTPFRWTTKPQYEHWKKENEVDKEEDQPDLWEKIIAQGETKTLEFKPSFVYNFDSNTPNHIPLFNNARTICGFLNSKGGHLLMGMTDDGKCQGIKNDLKLLGSKDKIRLKVDNLMSSYFNNSIASLIEVSFKGIDNQEILVIAVKPSKYPMFLQRYNPRTEKTTKHFYVRRNASTTEIKDVEEIISYVFNQWEN